jgi:membrane fusion protein (multidrug efflux system)
VAKTIAVRACALFMAAAVILAACERGQKSETDANAQVPPPAVTVVSVQSTDLRPTITFTGRVEAVDKVDLRARVPGFLEQQTFTEGALVKKGDLLFVIEKAPYEASLAEAKAVVAAGEAAVKRSQIEYDRQAKLVSQDVAAKTRLDDATVKRDESRANLSQNKAALQKAELQLGYTDIRSPIDGRIGRSAYSVGNFVEPSSGTLATIVSQDPIYVTFPITQREVLEIEKRVGGGAKAQDADIGLQLADGSRYSHSGKVNFVDVVANQSTDSVLVRAAFPNPDGFLVDGQLVGVIAEGGKPEPVLAVPQIALQIDQAGAYVLIVDAENKIDVRRIEPGPIKGENVAVRSGLVAGDRVVTQGIQKVRPGQVVSPSLAD